jgi:para-nitrobenzyl esterase
LPQNIRQRATGILDSRRSRALCRERAAIVIALALCAAQQTTAQVPSSVVRIEGGRVSGAVEGDVVSWKGVPFAAPPVGELRWRAPQPVRAWKGVRAATAYANDCMQEPFGGDAAPLGTPPAEDCLYANVWKLAGTTGKLPVVFWIYGGGFVNGGSSPPTYSGAPLARQGVMFVSFNYRVGRFGTFAHPALTRANEDKGLLANYGYLDQIAALEWVRRNIAAFGGDPANITVIGESAGGGSVHNLLTSPMSQGLFQRAVIMSGGGGKGLGMGSDSLAQAEEKGVALAQANGIARDDPQALAKLRALSAEKVTDGLNLVKMFQGARRTYASPFPDGRIAVDTGAAYAAGKFNHVPVMVGATSDDIGGPTGSMVSGAREVAQVLTDKGVPVYYYMFSYVPESLRMKGAPHASDIPFFFDTQAVKYAAATTPRDNAMGAAISAYIARFAKTGNPNGGDLPQWRAYSRAEDTQMDLAADGRPAVRRDPLAPATR